MLLISKYGGPGVERELDVTGGMVIETDSEHDPLRQQFKQAFKSICEDDVAAAGQTGLNFGDLQSIARKFLFTPRDERQKRQWYSNW